MENAAIDTNEKKDVRVLYHDINKWMAKEDEPVNDEASKLKPQPPTKKLKRPKDIDLETLAAEKHALEEMGAGNWIGKLQRMVISSLSFSIFICSQFFRIS
jgi:hypothetical protein